MGIRKIIFMMMVACTVCLITRCFQPRQNDDARGDAFAGSAKCMSCHQSISSSYVHTAHFLSTQIANETNVMGKFSKDSNELIVNDSTRILMEKRDSGLYQVLYVHNKPVTAMRFDLLMGSVKGQTYLSWQGTGLFQLPVSYITALHRWSSSPGYALAGMKFSRSITKDCFECHSSFANRDEHGLLDFRLNPNSWVFNIDCERCHGPSAAHVQYQTDHPDEKQARFVVSFKSLNRQQKIDLCAVCHNGNKNILLKSRFAFKMGDSLKNYMIPISGVTPLDVHGNQTQLLSASKCFRMSNLDCTTCHNIHVSERGMTGLFNARCQSCHAPGSHFCKMADDSNLTLIKNNCTNCHMPRQASNAIRVQASANSTVSIPTMVVNHRIAIYPEETAKILNTKNYDHTEK